LPIVISAAPSPRRLAEVAVHPEVLEVDRLAAAVIDGPADGQGFVVEVEGALDLAHRRVADGGIGERDGLEVLAAERAPDGEGVFVRLEGRRRASRLGQ
jgi:hypothetical protein